MPHFLFLNVLLLWNMKSIAVVVKYFGTTHSRSTSERIFISFSTHPFSVYGTVQLLMQEGTGTLRSKSSFFSPCSRNWSVSPPFRGAALQYYYCVACWKVRKLSYQGWKKNSFFLLSANIALTWGYCLYLRRIFAYLSGFIACCHGFNFIRYFCI